MKSRSNPERRLVRLNNAAAYLGLSTWTLRRLIQEGQIPIVRYGDNAAWLIDVRDLDNWIDAHKKSV